MKNLLYKLRRRVELKRLIALQRVMSSQALPLPYNASSIKTSSR